MKKKYVTPETEVIAMMMCSGLLAGSTVTPIGGDATDPARSSMLDFEEEG